MATTIHLVRHGEVYNPDRVLYGRLDGYHLSGKGRKMAQLVADALVEEHRDVVAVVSSPLQRAIETAEPIARAFDLEIRTDPRLIEAGNEFEGTSVGAEPWQLLKPKYWARFRNPMRPSWGEPYTEQVDRMRAAILDARARYADHEAVLVSHQLPIWVSRLSVEGKRLWHDPRRRECSLCSITSLTFTAPGVPPEVRYWEPAAQLAQELSDGAWSVK